MDSPTPKLIHYRTRGSNNSVFPGAHLSRMQGQGFVFREHDTFIRTLDQKRIDIHATLRNPMGEIMVKTFNQKSTISINVIADLSASISAKTDLDKLQIIQNLSHSLAFSARAYGDRFSFTGCNDEIDQLRSMPLSRDVSQIDKLVENLQEDCLRGSATALPKAHTTIGSRQSIVFLVSDFLLPRELLTETLNSLASHYVIPVVIGRDQNLPGNVKRGLVSLLDSETGKYRKVFVRPKLLKQYRQRCNEFYASLMNYFSSHQLRPLLVNKAFDADEVSAYFYS